MDACCATMVGVSSQLSPDGLSDASSDPFKVRSAQQMLGIVAELKRGLMVNDFPALIEDGRLALEEAKESGDSGQQKAEAEEALEENAMETSKS